MPLDLDPRFTFETFVIGPANRLAAAAARRVADVPGTTYNPLFMYGPSGLGKTHLLTAIGHRTQRVHGLRVLYLTLEQLMEEVSAAFEAGDRDAFRGRLGGTGILLMDDVQFLAGQRQAQEELIRAWDALSARGAQVVLSSDRPPQEIDGLDDRLVSRLSGGLLVDIGAPDFETRVAIARRKAEERGHALPADVCRALARVAFTNVRELQGALNRVIAIEELEDRAVPADEVLALLGAAAADRGTDEFGEFLAEVTGTVSALVEETDRRVADAILAWEGEGYRTRRLEGALDGSLTAEQATELVRRFESDIARLREIEAAIADLEPGAPEIARAELLRDPDRVAEAEALLVAVRERLRPPPAPPDGPGLDAYPIDSLAVRAARAIAAEPGAYNPLYLLGPAGPARAALLAAIGNAMNDQRVVGFVSGSAFADEVVDALERGHLEAWRARYRRADVLLLDDLEVLGDTERAQEELFHLFEDLHRAGRQLVFAASAPPRHLPLPPRLRSRLEAGLVVELDAADLSDAAAAGAPAAPAEALQGDESPDAPRPGDAAAVVSDAERRGVSSLLSPEKVLWEWPYAEDWLQEAMD